MVRVDNRVDDVLLLRKSKLIRELDVVNISDICKTHACEVAANYLKRIDRSRDGRRMVPPTQG